MRRSISPEEEIMQVAKLLKVRVGAGIARQLEIACLAEGIAAAEVVRRALYLYFNAHPAEAPAAGALLAQSLGDAGDAAGVSADPEPEGLPEGPWEGPSRALEGPAAAPPSFSPPSSPPAPPLTPPSLSPPALFAPRPPERPEPPASADPPDPPPVLVFPCLADRCHGATQWGLSPELLAGWEETFPGMDVVGEARKAREWLFANHRKTHRGMRAFLLRWLIKAQDSGRFMRRSERAAPGTPKRPEPGSLQEAYGFASWEEWEAVLRQLFEGAVLDRELGRLAALRAKWEATHAAAA
jgi:hypothetical protein